MEVLSSNILNASNCNMTVCFPRTNHKWNTDYHKNFLTFPAYAPEWCPPPQKNTFKQCRLASKYDLSSHARNELTKDRGSPFSFIPPLPQRSASPIFWSKIQNCCTKAHLTPFRKLLTKKRTCNVPKHRLPIFWKLRRKLKWPWSSSCFPWIFS